MLWRRMDYCFHIPPLPTPPTPSDTQTNGLNKMWRCGVVWCGGVVWCVVCGVYWLRLWSPDEEHKLNTIKPPSCLPPSLPPYFLRTPLVTIKVRTRNISLWSLRCAETGIFARQTLTANNNSRALWLDTSKEDWSDRSECYINSTIKKLLCVEFKWL